MPRAQQLPRRVLVRFGAADPRITRVAGLGEWRRDQPVVLARLAMNGVKGRLGSETDFVDRRDLKAG
jgi:hypothetical protein